MFLIFSLLLIESNVYACCLLFDGAAAVARSLARSLPQQRDSLCARASESHQNFIIMNDGGVVKSASDEMEERDSTPAVAAAY